jgi:hypothetical protein
MNAKRWAWVCVMGAAAAACGAPSGDAETTGGSAEALKKGPSCPAASPVDLIAIGAISGTIADRSTETAAPLENGVAGNLLGGLGSGIAHAGGDVFVAVPDRGPNAVSYDSAVDDTASYVNRLETFRLALTPSAAGAALPFSLTPRLLDTTLFFTREDLVYGTGEGLGVGSGVPAIDRKHAHYFTGRSDGYDATQPSSDPLDARLDPEGVRVSRSGEHVYVSDEYGPHIYEYSRETGRRTRTFTLPPELAVTTLSPQGAVEISANTSGRVANKGMEGLAIAPDGRTLFGAIQSPLLQDGGTSGGFLRIVSLDLESGATKQFAYPLTNIGTAAKPKYPTVSELLAINDHEFLVDERDGNGLGDNSTAKSKKVYRIDLTGAADVSGITGEANLAPKAVTKTLFLDIVAVLEAHGFRGEDIPAKLEGLAFGEDVTIGCARVHTLFVTNDNDFVGTVKDTNHPDGIDNPNRFFVFGIDPSALPTYEPQKLEGGERCD